MKAFPLKAVNKFDDSEGMDLRDYFAARAMQGVVSNSSHLRRFETPEQVVRVAEVAYMVADAMMQVREGKG
jgi:hypothetical protein